MTNITFRNPRLVAIILLVLISAGLSAFLTIGRQEDPTMTNMGANVTVNFPGAEPGRVEALVTTKIEDELRTISEIAEIDSTSAIGISAIRIELIETIAKNKIEEVWVEVRQALETAQHGFPVGAGQPELSTDGGGTYTSIIAFKLLHDEVPLTIATKVAEDFASILRNIPGTNVVDLFGVAKEEVLVELNLRRITSLGLTAKMVSDAIAASDNTSQSGQVKGNEFDLIIEVAGEIESLDRLRDIIVRTGDDGKSIRLGDIADVTRGIKYPIDEMARHNGNRAILVGARLEDGLQVDVWSSYVREELEIFRPGVPGGLSVDQVFDQSVYTSERLLSVGLNMLIGIAIVVSVLFVTLGIKAAMIVAVILPVVSLASLATINFIGLEIHQMSVTGMIVALGLLVDAGIVMTDEVGRRIQNGEKRKDAVSQSVHRLTGPLAASTITTALAFTPMILLPGNVGDFVGSIAIPVVIMLCWSFIISILVTSAMAGWFMPSETKKSNFQSGISGGILARGFRQTLLWSVSYPTRSISLAIVFPLLGFLSMSSLPPQFFPGVERNQFYIELEMGPGTSITRSISVVDRLDNILMDEPDISNITWVTGKSAPAFYYNITGGQESVPQYAQALITTTSAEATNEIVPRLQRMMLTIAPEAQVLVRSLVQGPPVSAPVELRFVGEDLAVLRQLGDDARKVLSKLDSVTATRSTANAGAPKVAIEIDEAKARLLGLDLTSVSQQLQANLDGVVGGTFFELGEQFDIRVRAGSGIQNNLVAIMDIPIILPDTSESSLNSVPLSAIASIALRPSNGSISRLNAQRVNTVQAYLLHGVLPEVALKRAEEELEAVDFQIPANYRMEIGGDSDERSSTLTNMLASIGLIIILSIATISITFNSFRLTAITFIVAILSGGLSILALVLFQYPLGITAVIGIIGSIGVSVNAAIIILTGLQRDEGSIVGSVNDMTDIIMKSSRHIVSTTITTVGGFLPLILAGGGFWPPFAVAIAGGVLLSTIITFYITPPLFALVYARKGKQTETTFAGQEMREDAQQITYQVAAE